MFFLGYGATSKQVNPNGQTKFQIQSKTFGGKLEKKLARSQNAALSTSYRLSRCQVVFTKSLF